MFLILVLNLNSLLHWLVTKLSIVKLIKMEGLHHETFAMAWHMCKLMFICIAIPYLLISLSFGILCIYAFYLTRGSYSILW